MVVKFQFRNKEYQLLEPTVQLWTKLMSLKDWTDEQEFSVMLISNLCNIPEDEIKKVDWETVIELSKSLSNYILQDSKKFYNEFEFEGIKYRFIDLPNLTFGEFIDIDTFLMRDKNERLKDTHLLMAMFYREVEDGKLSAYDSSKLEKRAEKFKNLPIKYVNGSSTFFLLLEKILQQNSMDYSKNKVTNKMKKIWIWMKLLPLTIFGAGLIRSHSLQTRILRKLKQSLIIH